MVRLLMTSGMERDNLLSWSSNLAILFSIPNYSGIGPMMLFPERPSAWRFSNLEMNSGISLARWLSEKLNRTRPLRFDNVAGSPPTKWLLFASKSNRLAERLPK
jgi:hypothetical protein